MLSLVTAIDRSLLEEAGVDTDQPAEAWLEQIRARHDEYYRRNRDARRRRDDLRDEPR